MFNQGGLSLDQAPPISVVLRFFVTGALFGLVAAGMLLFYGETVFDAATPQARMLTHTLALGVMGSFMLGALFQMLPVIAGVVLQNPVPKAAFVHTAFTLGVVTLLLAFRYAKSTLYLAAALLLGAVLLYATLLMLYNLFRLKNHSASSKGMLTALLGFTVAIVLGLYLLTALGGMHASNWYTAARTAHYSFALFGWVALLIVAISFQVVEMFYVTPPYPAAFTRYLSVTIFMLLLLRNTTPFATLFDLLVALLFMFYAAVTLHRLYRRRRPTSDATVWLWRLGMGLLLVAMLLFAVRRFTDNPVLTAFSYDTFVLFVLSVLFAMVYKIVPFLVWFHLSNQGYMKAPLMHDIIHPKKVKLHFYLHTATAVSLLAAALWPPLLQASALLALATFGWLLYQLGYAIYLYRHTQKHSEKMVW